MLITLFTPLLKKKVGKMYLKLAGNYIGVEPGTKNVYADRDAGGSWEEVELTLHPDGHYTALFVASNLQLSIQPDNRLETRPSGTDGAWEQLSVKGPVNSPIMFREGTTVELATEGFTVSEPLQQVHVEGDNFVTADGKRWLWCMASNFCLPQFVAEGRDIKPLLYEGVTGYRMFGTYHNIASQMGMKDFHPKNYPNWLNAISDTFDILAAAGKYGQLNLLCDMQYLPFNLGEMKNMHRDVTEMLKSKKNAFYSLGNENFKNGFNADDFDRPSGVISACGSGGTGDGAPLSKGKPWDIQHQHLRRDEKMFIDIPPVDAPTYGMEHKLIFDETIGWWGNENTTGSRTGNLEWAFKLGRIMSAFNGGTIHLDSGIHSNPLSPREKDAVSRFRLGMFGESR